VGWADGRVCMVVPTYNEADNLSWVVGRLRDTHPDDPSKWISHETITEQAQSPSSGDGLSAVRSLAVRCL